MSSLLSPLTRKIAFTFVLLCLSCSLAYAAPPTFSASFSPATVGPETESTITYTITTLDQAIRSGGFTHTFANLIFASPAGATSDCTNILLTAADGGNTLTASSIDIVSGSSCTISVNAKSVNGVAPVVTADLSGDFTSDAGNSGNVNPSLTVVTTLPGYNISFAPDPVNLGEITRLTINIDNTLNGVNVLALTTTINLPANLPLSSAPNESITCVGGSVTAVANSNSFSINAGSVIAGATCTASVDVQANQLGELTVSALSLQAFTSGFLEVGKATTSLTVSEAFAVAVFDPLVASPGGTSTLTFTLTNRDRVNALTNIAFTDDLNAALTGLAASSLPASGFCGGGSIISGTSTISVSGASLAPEASCTFSIPVSIPAGAVPGSYTNTTSAFTDDSGSNPAVSNSLVVSAAPLLTMSFVDGNDLVTPVTSVTPGQDLGVKFTLTNSDAVNTASAIAFTLDATSFIDGLTIKTLPAANSCGAGSTFFNTGIPPEMVLSVSGGNLAASASCTFDMVLTLPSSAASGDFSFTTSDVSATISAASVSGLGASDDISVVGGPSLSLGVTPAAATPGDQVIATFTLTTSANAGSNATGIGFSVDLDAALTGLTASALPADGSCGAGSTVTGSSTLVLAGASLGIDDSCTFNVTLDVPGGAIPGSYSLATSAITSTVSGIAVTGNIANASLAISGLTGSMSFLDDPVDPTSINDTSRLEFTINNAATGLDATAMVFTLDLNAGLNGLAATVFPTTPCGASSSLVGASGNTLLIFSGGELTSGSSCTFEVTVQVPGSAVTGNYNVVSSALSATVNGSNTTDNFQFLDSLEILVDEAPDVIITSDSSPSTSIVPFIATITFNEIVTGFDISDIVPANATLGGFLDVSSVDQSIYTVEVSAIASGTVTLQIPAASAQDLGLNDNLISNLFSIQYDAVAFVLPTVAVGAASTNLTNTGPVSFAVTYSDADPAQIDLSAADVNLVGTPTATISVANGNTATPTITLSSIAGNGTLSINLSADTARNSFGSTAATGDTVPFTVDNVQPGVVISTGSPDPTNAAFNITMTFDEVVVNFIGTDIVSGNGVVSNFSGSGAVYTATVTPVTSGTVTVDIPISVANDGAGNGNTASNQLSLTFDNIAPQGYDFTIDQTFLNDLNDDALSFTYTGAEISATYNYEVTDGVGSVTGSGVIGSASAVISAIDVTGLLEGSLTVNFTLTDPVGNVGITRSSSIIKQYNDAPIITEGATIGVTMSEDGSPAAFSLTLNATDAEAETLTWSISVLASNGIASATGTGNSKVIGYSPTGDFNGTDNFTVEITDNNALEPKIDSIVVSVTIDAVNDAGSVSIDDTTPTQGQTLTATVTDVDGASGVISYQWQSGGSNVGSNSATYTTVQSDVGQMITVSATYTDDLATPEAPVSTATSAVSNVNDAGSVSIDDTTPTQGQTLTAIVTDPDGATGVISYQWNNGVNNVGINSATYTTVQSDVNQSITVTATYIDDLSTPESPVSSATAAVINVNDLPTGQPVITGVLMRNETLSVDTSSIDDEDGLGSFSYQWRRSGSAIFGANSSTYVPGETDVGSTLSVILSYVDGAGASESVTSPETAAISDLDSDGDGITDLEEGTVDSDGDGIPDYLDEDSDNDGIPDSVEGNDDSDGDGIANYLDTSLDEDGDGIPDVLDGDANTDTDGDGVIDALDTDSDNDGVSDFDESGATGLDSDSDGIDDAFDVDVTGGVDANGDGVDDDVAPLDTDGDGIPDYIDRDSDNDSVPDALENREATLLKRDQSVQQKIILLLLDTDGDGVKDYLDLDSDEDGISDRAEAATNFVDSDLDQIIDEFDVDFTGGLDADLDGVDDAAVLQNSDNDATPDMFDLDADNDGINDVNEAGLTDADFDGLVDSPIGFTDTPVDSDLDGLADYRDLDSDNDAIFDIANAVAANLDLDNDGQIDDIFASADADGDGIVDLMDEEPNQFGTRPDRDLDGIPSSIDLDDDGDGLSDIFEGVLDSDSDGIIDSLDNDSDGDTISDTEEQLLVALLNIDSDFDGLDDALDIDLTGGVDADNDGMDDSTVSTDDIDGDGLLAFQDIDTDGDGVADADENGDFNNDGINDRLQVEKEVQAFSGSGSFSIAGLVMLLLLLTIFRKTAAIKIVATLLVFSAFSASAEETCDGSSQMADTCWYVNIGSGRSSFDLQTSQTSWKVVDDNGLAINFTIGADFNKKWFAELGHSLLGKARLSNRNPAQTMPGYIKYSVTDGFLGFRHFMGVSDFSVNLKAGFAYINASSNFIKRDTDTLAAFGAGIVWHSSARQAISLDYEQYGDDINLLSLNLKSYF